jgi:hypothetical protein
LHLKPSDPEITEFEGYTWKWCNKCFGGFWNRTHVTEEHQPEKGKSKNKKTPPPSQAEDQAKKSDITANLAMLVLSIFYAPVITSLLSHHSQHKMSSLTSPTPLLTLPDSIIFIYNNYIYIYTWFYNQFILPYRRFSSLTSPIEPSHKSSRLR